MRVFHFVKAFQMATTLVGIYRLLFVEELCEIRYVKSLTECAVAMKLSLPEFNMEFFNDDMKSTEKKLSRKTRLTNVGIGNSIERDASLEEIHEKKVKSEMTTTMTVMQHTEPQSLHKSMNGATTKIINVHDTMTSEKPETVMSTKHIELSSTTNSYITTIKKELPSTADSFVKTTTKELPTTSDSYVKVTKKESPSTVDSSTNIIVKAQKEVMDNERNTSITFIMENTENSTKVAVNDVSVTARTKKQTDLLQTDKKKAAEEVFITPTKRINLINEVHNCLKIGVRDLLGTGDVIPPYAAALRFPIGCLILSLLILCLSMTNFSRPRRFRLFAVNITLIVLWMLSGFTLLLTRQDWKVIWNSAVPGAFVPEYPPTWYFAEISCYMMVILFTAEFYLYDRMFYKITFEECFGSYSIVGHSHHEDAVYMSTIETTEEHEL